MSALTPTPLPEPRPDEVTQPSAEPGAGHDDVRRALSRSPAQWEAEALALVEEAEAREGPMGGAFRYAAARMLEEGVGDVAAAVEHLELAIDDPAEASFRAVLRALRLHAVENGSAWTAIDLIDVERAAASESDERLDLIVEKGELLEHALSAPIEARAVIMEALALRPAHPAALLALEASALRAMAAGEGAGPALLQSVLERRLAHARAPAERGRILCRLALLAESDPRRSTEALALWLRALEEDAGRGAAALARAGTRRMAAALRKDAELARAAALEAEAVSGVARAAWLALGAALARHRLGAAARAGVLLEEARVADPDDPALLAGVVSAHLAGGQWAKARMALDHHAALTSDRDWAAASLGLGAHLAEQHEADDGAAAARYRRLLDVRPADLVALAALERIASRSGDAAAQVALAEGAVDRSADPAERAALALRAAELAETAAHDLPRAAALARRALGAVPGYAPAAHLLERLLPALELWDEMVKVVDVTSAPGAFGTDGGGDNKATRLERLGGLYEDRLGDPGRALALYAEWVDLGTRRGAALAALLRAAEKAGDALVAAEAALRIGTEVDGLDGATKFAWCCRAAAIYEERAAADDEAIRAYEAALALSPGARPVLAGLARAHQRRGRFDAVAALLSKLAEREPNPTSASMLELEGARILALRLGRAEPALAAVDRALAFDPTNVAAMGDRARLLERLGRAEDLAAALAGLAQVLADPADKSAAYRLQADVLEWQLGRPREALVAIERASAAVGHARSFVAEERLWQLAGRGAELAALRLKHLGDGQLPASGEGELGMRLDLAWRLADGEAAARALHGALEAAPTDGAVLDAGVALAFRIGRDRAIGQAFERVAEATPDAETRAALWQAAARALEREAGGEPQQETLLLWSRAVEARATPDLLAILARRAAAAGDSARLVLARRRLAEQTTEPLIRAAMLWDLARARVATGDLGGADADFARAVESEPGFLPAVQDLARLREAAGDARAAAELGARAARSIKAPARAAEAFRGAARLYSNHVHDDDMAARCLEEVLAIEPEAETDFEALQVILRARGDEDRLAQVMRRRATAGPPAKRRDRLLALAELLYARDTVEAAAVLEEAVKLDPRSAPVLLRLADLQAELGRSAEAIETYRSAIRASPDAKAVSAAWVRIGDIAERALADVDQAVWAYRNALLAAPDDLSALAGLARGLTRARDYAEAAIALRRLAGIESDAGARVGHLVTLGELLAGPAEEPESAADVFEQALAIEPGNEAALDRLDTLLTALEEPSRLATALGRFLEATPGARPQRMRLAGLWSGPLASPKRAVDELRIVVSGSPADVHARVELARVLEASSRVAEAMTEHLAILRLEPLRVDALRAMRRLAEQAGQPRRALRVAAALTALGLADAGEARAARDARTRWVPEWSGSVGAAEFESVVRHPDSRHPATALLAAMSEVLPRLYGLAVEDWGVTKQDRLGARSEDPTVALVTRVAALLGVEETFEVYVARAIATQVEIEAGPPPALLLPSSFGSLPRQEAFSQLGRQLGHLRVGTHGIGRIPPKDLGLLIAAGVRTMFPDYGRGILPEERLRDVAQKIARMLPRRTRRAFDQAALSFRDAGVFDGERWRASLAHTSYRAALIASGDVLGLFEHIIRTDRRLGAAVAQAPHDLLAPARNSAVAVEMIQFAIGEELATINRRLGTD
jgi:Tfp pilus assembly protein PilF